MSDLQFISHFDVRLIDSMGNDMSVVRAARVSTQGENEPTKDAPGLINHLMKARHGSPFEHNAMTFYVHAPIFVWREFMRHRIASYNEESARYTQLKPVFYVPPPDRKLVQIGKASAYELVKGSQEQHESVVRALQSSYTEAYQTYTYMLEVCGVAREVARDVLPVGIYSSAYVTMNARALMNFLSLRVKDRNSTFPSNPQWEINQVANQMEFLWSSLMPVTWLAFVENGRVCP